MTKAMHGEVGVHEVEDLLNLYRDDIPMKRLIAAQDESAYMTRLRKLLYRPHDAKVGFPTKSGSR